jgi:DNA-binding transcriptional LysR family regulator
LLDRALTAYHKGSDELPRADVVVAQWGDVPRMLAQGEADLALLHLPVPTQRLEVEPLVTEPRMVALPVGHPLAAKALLAKSDLANETTPSWPGVDDVVAAYWDGRDAGIAVRTASGPAVRDLSQLLEVVGLGQAIAFVPASAAALSNRDDIIFRPVGGLSPSVTALAWSRGARSAAAAAFVHAASAAAPEPVSQAVGRP